MTANDKGSNDGDHDIGTTSMADRTQADQAVLDTWMSPRGHPLDLRCERNTWRVGSQPSQPTIQNKDVVISTVSSGHVRQWYRVPTAVHQLMNYGGVGSYSLVSLEKSDGAFQAGEPFCIFLPRR